MWNWTMQWFYWFWSSKKKWVAPNVGATSWKTSYHFQNPKIHGIFKKPSSPLTSQTCPWALLVPFGTPHRRDSSTWSFRCPQDLAQMPRCSECNLHQSPLNLFLNMLSSNLMKQRPFIPENCTIGCVKWLCFSCLRKKKCFKWHHLVCSMILSKESSMVCELLGREGSIQNNLGFHCQTSCNVSLFHGNFNMRFYGFHQLIRYLSDSLTNLKIIRSVIIIRCPPLPRGWPPWR